MLARHNLNLRVCRTSYGRLLSTPFTFTNLFLWYRGNRKIRLLIFSSIGAELRRYQFYRKRRHLEREFFSLKRLDRLVCWYTKQFVSLKFFTCGSIKTFSYLTIRCLALNSNNSTYMTKSLKCHWQAWFFTLRHCPLVLLNQYLSDLVREVVLDCSSPKFFIGFIFKNKSSVICMTYLWLLLLNREIDRS